MTTESYDDQERPESGAGDTAEPAGPAEPGTQAPAEPEEPAEGPVEEPGASGKRFSWEPDFVDPPERTGPPRWVGIAIGFTVSAAAAGAAFYVIDPWSMDAMTCERLGKEAAKVSALQDDGRLADVTDPRLVSDDRKSYTPPTGKDREVVMTCAATGWWSNNSTSDITLTLEVDAEENLLVFYVPTPGGESSRGA